MRRKHITQLLSEFSYNKQSTFQTQRLKDFFNTWNEIDIWNIWNEVSTSLVEILSSDRCYKALIQATNIRHGFINLETLITLPKERIEEFGDWIHTFHKSLEWSEVTVYFDLVNLFLLQVKLWQTVDNLTKNIISTIEFSIPYLKYESVKKKVNSIWEKILDISYLHHNYLWKCEYAMRSFIDSLEDWSWVFIDSYTWLHYCKYDAWERTVLDLHSWWYWSFSDLSYIHMNEILDEKTKTNLFEVRRNKKWFYHAKWNVKINFVDVSNSMYRNKSWYLLESVVNIAKKKLDELLLHI